MTARSARPHRDTSVPAWRECSTDYRLYAVVFPYVDPEIVNAVAIVAFFPPGWEGVNRRFVAAPIGTSERRTDMVATDLPKSLWTLAGTWPLGDA